MMLSLPREPEGLLHSGFEVSDFSCGVQCGIRLCVHMTVVDLVLANASGRSLVYASIYRNLGSLLLIPRMRLLCATTVRQHQRPILSESRRSSLVSSTESLFFLSQCQNPSTSFPPPILCPKSLPPPPFACQFSDSPTSVFATLWFPPLHL